MEHNELNENKSTLGKVIVPIFLIGLLAGLYFYKDSLLNLFINAKKGPALAEISVYRNDVRLKDSKSIDFTSAKTAEQIYHGDSLSTGSRSSALVTFKSGQILSVDQNSLIIFDELTDTPEFVEGNIKLTVKGKMKVKVNNEVIELSGNHSDIQLYKDEKSKTQKIVLLSGSAEVKTAKKEFVPLQRNIPVEPKNVYMAEEVLNEQRMPSTENKNPSILVPKAPLNARTQYKLYDYYTRLLSSNNEFGRNLNFTLKPNSYFEPFTPTSVAFMKQNSDEDPTKNPFAFKINDPTAATGYVVEVSTQDNFPDGATKYAWKSSYFGYNFSTPGTFYLRFRKVLHDQILTDYSPTEKIIVPEKVQKPILAKNPEPIKKPVEKALPKPDKKPIVKKQEIEKPVIAEQKPVVIERQPTAVESQKIDVPPETMQSSLNTSSLIMQRNQNYTMSYVSLRAVQSYLASGLQIGNSNPINAGYGLEIAGTYWLNQQGFRGSFNKTLSTQTSTNLVTTAELDYLYRFTRPWTVASGGNFQYYLSVGLENYQNSQSTSDFVDSYNMYKLGIGASMPVFSFWSLDGQMSYGLGDGQKTLFSFAARANYFITKKYSLGLGYRARKYDYYLLDTKNYESLSETFAIFNMYY